MGGGKRGKREKRGKGREGWNRERGNDGRLWRESRKKGKEKMGEGGVKTGKWG